MDITRRQALLAGLGIVAGAGVVRQVPSTGIPPIGSPYPIDKDGGFIVPQRMEHLIPKRVVRADGAEWLDDWFVAHCRHVQRATHMRQSRQRLRVLAAPSPGKQV